METLNEFLKNEAIKRGMSLSQLAMEIGVNHRTLTATTFRKPRIETMAKISRYLNVNLMELNLMPIKEKSDN